MIAAFAPDSTLATLNESVTYEPFGRPLARTGAASGIGYQGDWTDPDTGQVNMHARWYEPSVGTFTSRDDWTLDPTGVSIAANRYTYANGDPINNIDPTVHDAGVLDRPVTRGAARGMGAACRAGIWGCVIGGAIAGIVIGGYYGYQ
ncbi:RHS repeat-associated core domain-containing protein [Spirillospora sp. CA-255316]